jgi:hypothetical protein
MKRLSELASRRFVTYTRLTQHPESLEDKMPLAKFTEVKRPDQSSLPLCLVELTDGQKSQIDSTLSNDEVSTEEEILELWKECGIPEDAAKAAIGYRPTFFAEVLFQLFPYTGN